MKILVKIDSNKVGTILTLLDKKKKSEKTEPLYYYHKF